jgi:hypothetical protein
MARYILIDNHSGYIFGDTADLPRVAISTSEGVPMSQSDMAGPVDAARWLDEAVVREYGRSYEECRRHELASNENGYHVYRADIDGSDAVATVTDGQSADEIEAVERDCQYVTAIRTVATEA